jgi:hypothetical protein
MSSPPLGPDLAISGRFTDEDIEAAVAAGALTADAASRFRTFVDGRRATPSADEESFRLITGFNDIFVSIAIILVLIALGWLGSRLDLWVGGALVGATSWALAEFFTRRRRMALPSIVLLIAFVGAVLGVGFRLVANVHSPTTWGPGMLLVGAAAVVAAYLHWLRFKVPITVAAGAAAAVIALVAATRALDADGRFITPLLAVSGLAVFALALWWDASDPQRKTRRADVAFWLHLCAAPLIVHPAFTLLGLSRFSWAGGATAGASAGEAIDLYRPAAAVAIYLALAWVALLIDRRALMVSGLIYWLYAMNEFFRSTGALSVSLALSALIAGGGLLLLSAYWSVARRRVLAVSPASLKARLPAA